MIAFRSVAIILGWVKNVFESRFAESFGVARLFTPPRGPPWPAWPWRRVRRARPS